MFTREFTISATLIICFNLLLQTAYGGKSVFVISSHDTCLAEAFRIDANGVSFQAMVDISTYNPGIGPVGVAVWPQKELAFFTYEGSPMIVWSSTKTLEKVSEFNTDGYNLAGIVVDTTKQKIYVAERGTYILYVYSWNSVSETLVLDSMHALSQVNSMYGLALDEPNNRLYVSDNTATVRYYNTTTWAYQGSIDIRVSGVPDGNRPAVGIAVDPARGYLYTGNFSGGGGSHTKLVRTMTSSPYTSVEREVNYPVIGIDVDKTTGFVYCTTHAYYGQYTSDFRVYDSNLTLLDIERNSGIESPAGVAVGGWYKSPSFMLVKDNNDPNNNCVWPWNEIEENCLTFDICWDSNGHPDTNVVVVDQLPQEIDYDSSIPEGDYNEFDKTVRWNIGNISAGASGCVVLKTKVNEWARPCGTITNTAIMEGDTYLNEADCNVNVCSWGTDIIYVDRDANGFDNGTDWQNAYKDLQDALTQARNACLQTTAIWVAAGIYKPVWDTNEENYWDKSFELAEGVGLFGHFSGNKTSLDDRNFADANNETVLEGQIGAEYWEAVYNIVTAVDIDSSIVDGFTIQGSYSGSGIYLNDADISIVNCKLKDNSNYGIHAENYSHPDIHNCTFIDNSTSGVYSSTSQPDISYSILDGNDSTYYGLYMQSGSSIDVTSSVFKNHNSYGAYGSNGTLVIEDSLFENNNEGLYISDVTTTLSGCSIKQSLYYGVWASNSDLTVERSVIHGSQYNNGIYMQSYSNLDLISSVVRYSGAHGVHLTQNSQTNIKNCWIHNNGDYSNGSGIYFDRAIEEPLVRNNTIYDNHVYGIYVSENGGDPNVFNCIIYANDTNDIYRENDTFDNVKYCCLQHTHSGIGNIVADPCFKNPSNPNDLHISVDSQCKNAGDPCGNYENETDIDGEARVRYGRIDIGADEYYWSPADYDLDGIVNFLDYTSFADSWRLIDANISLDDDNDVDFSDLSLFCADWLWQKAADEGWMMCMSGGGDGFETMGLAESESAISLNVSKKVSVERDALMLSTAAESLAKRPQRLAVKSQKFYDITPSTTISARQRELESRKAAEKVDIKELLQWLDELWLGGDLDETMNEKEYLDFRDAVEELKKY